MENTTEPDSTDYTADRHKWLGNDSIEDIQKEAEGARAIVEGIMRVDAANRKMMVADPNGDFPRCKPKIGIPGVMPDNKCERCGNIITGVSACPTADPESHWSIDWTKEGVEADETKLGAFPCINPEGGPSTVGFSYDRKGEEGFTDALIAKVTAKLRSMTPAEAKEHMVKAGIIDRDGHRLNPLGREESITAVCLKEEKP